MNESVLGIISFAWALQFAIILSDGEDGLRGVVGTWFGKKCQHRLDWFHVARRIARIEKEFLYFPYGDDFQERLAAHWTNLNSMKWMLWNDGVEMAEFGMTRVRIGLFQHALAHPEANSERFEGIEAKLAYDIKITINKEVIQSSKGSHLFSTCPVLRGWLSTR